MSRNWGMALSLSSLTQSMDPRAALHGSNERDTYLMPTHNKAYKPIFLQHTRRLSMLSSRKSEDVLLCSRQRLWINKEIQQEKWPLQTARPTPNCCPYSKPWIPFEEMLLDNSIITQTKHTHRRTHRADLDNFLLICWQHKYIFESINSHYHRYHHLPHAATAAVMLLELMPAPMSATVPEAECYIRPGPCTAT